MADITDPRGKHLLGEAVRLLVQSGVAGAAITDFIQEYSQVIHTTLAQEPVPDMRSQIKEALTEVLAEFSTPSRQSKSSALTKRVTVHVNGARTTLSIRKALLEQAQEAMGDTKQIRPLLEQFANAKPEDRANRSNWVEEQLQHRLMLIKAESLLADQSRH